MKARLDVIWSRMISFLSLIAQNRVVLVVFFLLLCLIGVIEIKQLASSPKQPSPYSPYKQEIQNVEIVKIRAIVDRDFCVAANVIQRDLDEFERITLLLHISNDRLDDRVLNQVRNWNGPISLAIAFPDRTEFNSTIVKCAIEILLDLQVKDANVRKKLSVHFLSRNVTECSDFTLTAVPRTETVYKRQMSIGECTSKNEQLTQDQIAENLVKYPVNRARNVARKFATTKYILSADLDHLFSDGFEDRVLSLAGRLLEKEPKTVLVYRIFEVSDKAKKLPRTKKDLFEQYVEGFSQEFHKYYGAHSIPKLYEWFIYPESSDTEVQFYKHYTTHHWEPQFVSLNNIPEHDETFMYSVRDNTCLRWEMCRADFKFAIVHNVFMFHPGLKKVDEISVLKTARKVVGRKQRQIVNEFNERLDRMYPKTKKQCPNYD